MTAALVATDQPALVEAGPGKPDLKLVEDTPDLAATAQSLGSEAVSQMVLPRGVTRLGKITANEVQVFIDPREVEDPAELAADTIRL